MSEETRRKREAMTEAFVGTPEDMGPFYPDTEAAAFWSMKIVRRYETALALGIRKSTAQYMASRPVMTNAIAGHQTGRGVRP